MSFSGENYVLTSKDQLIKIKDLEKNTSIFAIYQGIKIGRVRAVRENSPQKILEIIFDSPNGVGVQTTENHEFLMVDGTYKPAKELKHDDIVCMMSNRKEGSLHVVAGTDTKPLPSAMFSANGLRYHIGKNDILIRENDQERLERCKNESCEKCILVHDIVQVDKKCPYCNRGFYVYYGDRERISCDICLAEKEENKNTQIEIFNKIAEKKGKLPTQQEWVAACRKNGINPKLKTKWSAFKQEAAQQKKERVHYKNAKTENFKINNKDGFETGLRVDTIREIGIQPCYEVCVDIFHSLAITLNPEGEELVFVKDSI